MGSAQGGDDSGAPRDELEALLAATLERIDREGGVALDQVCKEHPEHAALLRQRVLALRELGLIQTWTSDQPPQRLGDFHLLRRIGSGGMGVVYHAIQESLGREVALKLIRPETLHVAGARERFTRETKIIARLQHPGIVPIYSVGGEDELPYYAMELVHGCTLADALSELSAISSRRLTGLDLAQAVRARSPKTDAPLALESELFQGSWEQVALRIMRLVAEALEHAHGRGVLHRDLKPSNIMLTTGGRVMLVDFGLSHSEGSDSVTRSGERAGSLPFMPPELLKHGLRAVDRRSDIYSLGVTLYLLLTRRLPFAAEIDVEVPARILEGRPTPPRSIDRTISWEAETVCLAAMDRDPDRRYATAIDFARDLENALEHRPVAARRASPWLRARRWVETRPAASIAIALALLAPTAIAVSKVVEIQRVTRLSKQADGDRKLAQANFARALHAVDGMLKQVGLERLDSVPGVDPLRIELMREAASLYRELASERPDDHTLAVAAAECEILRARLMARMGDKLPAIGVLHEMIDRLQPAVLQGNLEARISQASALLMISTWSSNPDEAMAYQAASIGALDELRQERPELVQVQALLAKALSSFILEDRARGDRDSRLAMLDHAETIARACVASGNATLARRELASVLGLRGARLQREGHYEQALAPLREALTLCREIVGENPRGEEQRHNLCQAMSALSTILLYLNRPAEALQLLEEGAAEAECLLADFPDVHSFKVVAAGTMLNLGVANTYLKRQPQAGLAFERAGEVYRELLAKQPDDPQLHQAHGTALLNLCDSVLQSGDATRALEICAQSLQQFETAVALRPNHPDYPPWLAQERGARAKILLALGRTAEAAEALAEAPRLSGHHRDRAVLSLKRLLVALRAADEGGDTETQERCEAAVRLAVQRARERGDLDQEPTVQKLVDWLEAR